MRRFTRLTNAFSKKSDNHLHAVPLYFVFYSSCCIHKTLRNSPAMAAGVSDRLRSLVTLLRRSTKCRTGEAARTIKKRASPEDIGLPGYRFQPLRGVKRYAADVNGNYRLTWGWEDGDAIDVDVEDYH